MRLLAALGLALTAAACCARRVYIAYRDRQLIVVELGPRHRQLGIHAGGPHATQSE